MMIIILQQNLMQTHKCVLAIAAWSVQCLKDNTVVDGNKTQPAHENPA